MCRRYGDGGARGRMRLKRATVAKLYADWLRKLALGCQGRVFADVKRDLVRISESEADWLKGVKTEDLGHLLGAGKSSKGLNYHLVR